MARLQSEFCTKDFFRATNFLTKNAPKFSPNFLSLCSGTKKEPKPKLLSLDIFRWGRGLPHEGVRAKKFGMPLETREIKLFGRDIPGFCRDIPGVPEKFEKKSLGSIFVPYLFCGSEKIPGKFPLNFPLISKFPCETSKKIHRRASAGAQGEQDYLKLSMLLSLVASMGSFKRVTQKGGFDAKGSIEPFRCF